jgi:hypothetical protein
MLSSVARKILAHDIRSDAIYLAMVNRARTVYGLPELSTEDVDSWRNIALSISREGNYLAWRFMFIALLNLGMATVALLLIGSWVLAAALKEVANVSLSTAVSPWIWVLLLLVALIFLEGYHRFYARSMEVPFSMAVVQLEKQEEDTTPPEPPNASELESARGSQSQSGVTKIYLAGGLHSGWQEIVAGIAPRFTFLDPRNHELTDGAQYTLWDLAAIRRSDLVFAYLEPTNPAGYSLALEVGYAKALGKPVVLVDEKSTLTEETRRHTAMIHALADVTFQSLDDGLNYIKELEKTV